MTLRGRNVTCTPEEEVQRRGWNTEGVPRVDPGGDKLCQNAEGSSVLMEAALTMTNTGGAVGPRRGRKNEVDHEDIGGEGHLHRLVPPTVMQEKYQTSEDGRLNSGHTTEELHLRRFGLTSYVPPNTTSGRRLTS